MLSATMMPGVEEMAASVLKDPIKVLVDRDGMQGGVGLGIGYWGEAGCGVVLGCGIWMVKVVRVGSVVLAWGRIGVGYGGAG